MYKTKILTLFLVMMTTVLLSTNAEGGRYYNVEPAWWNSVKVSIKEDAKHVENEINRSAEEALDKACPTLFSYKRWGSKSLFVCGPFADNKGKPFEKEYVTEKIIAGKVSRAKAKHKTKSGKKVIWKKWKGGEEFPISDNKERGVYFISKRLEYLKPGKKVSFIVKSSEPYGIYVNGKEVVRDENPSSKFMDCKVVTYSDWDANKNRILIKYYSAEKPVDFQMRVLNGFTPEEVKLKATIMAAVDTKNTSDGTRNNYYKRLSGHYEKLGDSDNYFFWMKKRLLIERKQDRMLDDIKHIVSQNNELEGAFGNFLSSVIKDKSIAESVRSKAILYIIDYYINSSQLEKAERGIVKYSSYFNQNKKAYYTYLLNISILKGDTKESRRLVEVAKEKLPEIAKDKTFITFAKLAESMGGGNNAMVSVDWEFNNNVSSILTNAPDEIAFSKIRNILKTRSHYLLEVEKGFFVGVYEKYKEAFIKGFTKKDPSFLKNYRASNEKYIKIIKDNSKKSAKDLALLEQSISLDASRGTYKFKEWSAHKLNSSQIALPDGELTKSKILSMGMGSLDRGNSYTNIFRTDSLRAPFLTKKFGTYELIFNTTEIYCIKNDKMVWGKKFSNDIRENEVLIASTPTVITDEGKIYYKYYSNGHYKLSVISVESGQVLWQIGTPSKVVASNPVFWDSNLLMVIKDKEESDGKYLLRYFNKNSGKQEFEIELLAGGNEIELSRVRPRINTDFHPMALAIDKSTAYLNTHQGVICTIDLPRKIMGWLRTPSQMPVAISSSFCKNLVMRNYVKPIIGKKNALYAMIGGSSIILVDKKSGDVVKESFGYKWSNIIKHSSNSALVINENKTADLISLDSLSTTKIKGDEYLGMQELKDDKSILWTKEVVRVISSSGEIEKEYKLAEGLVPTGVLGNSIICYDADYAGIDVTKVGVFKLSSSPAKEVVLNNVSEQSELQVEEMRINTYKGITILDGENYVCRIDDSNKVIYRIPKTLTTIVKVFKGKLCLFREGQVFQYDIKTGELVSKVYDEFDIKPVSLSKFSEFEQGSLSLMKNPVYRNYIFGKLSDSKVNWSADMLIKKYVRGALDKGNVVITQNRYTYNIFKFKKGGYELFKEIKTKDNRDRLGLAKVSDKYALISNGKFLKIIDSQSVTSVDWSKSHFWSNHNRRDHAYDDGQFKSEKGYIGIKKYRFTGYYVIDKQSKKVAVKDAYGKPVFSNNLFVYPIRRTKDIKEVKLAIYDGKKETVIKDFKISSSAVSYCKYSIYYNGNAYFIFDSRHRADRYRTIMVKFNFETKEATQLPFPNMYSVKELSLNKESVLACIEGKFKTMDAKEFFEVGSKKARNFFTQEQPEKPPVVDGYPDEWEEKNFAKVGTSKLGVYNDASIYVGAYITDQKFIKEIGKNGMDNRFKFVMMSSQRAGFYRDRIAEGFEQKCEKSDLVDFAYSVAPDGSYCFIELKLYNKKAVPLAYNLSYYKKNTLRDMNGDIAFEIMLNRGTEEEPDYEYIISKGDNQLDFPCFKLFLKRRK